MTTQIVQFFDTSMLYCLYLGEQNTNEDKIDQFPGTEPFWPDPWEYYMAVIKICKYMTKITGLCINQAVNINPMFLIIPAYRVRTLSGV